MKSNKKVLVIDDEAHIRRVIEVKLKRQGYQIILAKNGKEGLDIIQTQKPDVVISDLMMPVMDGKTLCEKTNDLKKERPFLTIMITARIMPNEREWIDKMTDTLFIEKPFSPKEILECVKQYLGDQ